MYGYVKVYNFYAKFSWVLMDKKNFWLYENCRRCIENYRGFCEIHNLPALIMITGGGLWVRVPGRGCVGDLFGSAGHSGGKFQECHLHRSLWRHNRLDSYS